jgi:hydrogenase/urease accessory protein HupE
MVIKPKLFNFIILGLSFPHLSEAHSLFGDTQPIINGLLHPFITIPHLLILFSVGFLLLTHKQQLPILTVFISGLMLGFAGQWFSHNLSFEILTLILVGLAGVLVATKKQLPIYLLGFPIVLSSFIVGHETRSELESLGPHLFFMLSTTFGILAFFSYAVILKIFIKQEWQWVVIRALGSWLFAISLMMLAFYAKGLN